MTEPGARRLARSTSRREASRPPAIPPFQAFLDAQRGTVYRFLSATAEPHEVDDCFQETFLSALRAYPRLRNGENLRGWVLSIATRKVIDAARSRNRRPIPVPDVSVVGEPAGGDGPAILDRDEPIWRAIRTLPARQRAAVVQRFVLDLSYRDIAAAMNSTEETARANVHQALRKLRAAEGGWRHASE
jgi:DNA-directed RNA polymerase specialized sigma24 family protein